MTQAGGLASQAPEPRGQPSLRDDGGGGAPRERGGGQQRGAGGDPGGADAAAGSCQAGLELAGCAALRPAAGPRAHSGLQAASGRDAGTPLAGPLSRGGPSRPPSVSARTTNPISPIVDRMSLSNVWPPARVGGQTSSCIDCACRREDREMPELYGRWEARARGRTTGGPLCHRQSKMTKPWCQRERQSGRTEFG